MSARRRTMRPCGRCGRIIDVTRVFATYGADNWDSICDPCAYRGDLQGLRDAKAERASKFKVVGASAHKPLAQTRTARGGR